jgi:hypothetical protein
MKKRHLNFIPLLTFITILILFFIHNEHLNQKFIIKKINSKVLKRSSWQLRTTEFYLENGLRIDSTRLNNLNLKIGDSISKASNTKKFQIYRKNDLEKYEFYQIGIAE